MGIPKIKSASDLRKNLYNSLKEASEGEVQVVTHKQGEPVVMISQSQFNKMFEDNEILRNLNLGFADIEEGRSYSTEKLKAKLKNRRLDRDNGQVV